MIKTNFKPFANNLFQSISNAFIILAFVICVASCDSDEPESTGIEEGNAPSLVTTEDIIGKWTLVKDNVYYSEINPEKEDEVITYRGNAAPYYHFYNVTSSDSGIITITEVSATGSTIGTIGRYTLDGNNLVIVETEAVAGTIEHYDTKHTWDNLRIKWNESYSPIQFGAPVTSTYML